MVDRGGDGHAITGSSPVNSVAKKSAFHCVALTMQCWVTWSDGSAAPSVIWLPEIAHKPLSLSSSAYMPVNGDPSLQVATADAITVPIGELSGRDGFGGSKLRESVGLVGMNSTSTQ